ncbi:MAG TPA: hypothetical protein VN608_10570 [Clostridia bacterium]|nr:hypothetical protein [Clostridia bacterium]
MKKVKRYIGAMLAVAFVAIMSFSTLAASAGSSIPVAGYGTLAATLHNNIDPDFCQLYTSVTQNPDNAYFSHKTQLVNSAGTTLATGTWTSSRGGIGYGTGWDISSYSTAYRVYSTHEIKGGSIYSAAAIYLNISVS